EHLPSRRSPRGRAVFVVAVREQVFCRWADVASVVGARGPGPSAAGQGLRRRIVSHKTIMAVCCCCLADETIMNRLHFPVAAARAPY
ncbi:hypothetical protein ACJX0J_032471, partial [Zea mays]